METSDDHDDGRPRRGVVLPFRPRRRYGVAAAPRRHQQPAAETSTAEKLPTWDPVREAELNARWDRLLASAVQAWSWRDPESVAILDEMLRDVRELSRVDWST